MHLPGKHTSLWRTLVPGHSFPSLHGKIEADVAIIGAGITGITAGTILKAAGMSVVIVDAHDIGEGVTGNTTAHLTQILDTRYHELISNFSEEEAQLVAESKRAAIDRIEEFSRRIAPDCKFEYVPGYLYTEYGRDISTLEKEYQIIKKLGMDASFDHSSPLPFTVRASLRIERQAQFHPLVYLHALAETIPGNGSFIFGSTRVTGIDDRTPCIVHTENGSEIRARSVIIASHTPPGLDILQTREFSYSSYVLGVRLRDKYPPAGLYWDMEDPYHYTRLAEDHKGQLLIVGGEDHKTGEKTDTETCYEQLEEYIRSRYSLASIPYCWSAQVFEPADGLPYIGLDPNTDNVYVATGFAGNGITFGTLSAMIISDLIRRKENVWSEVYSPNRLKPIASAVRFISENFDAAYHFIADRFSKADARSLTEVPENEGRILTINSEKVAVYRNDAGKIFMLSPKCTHLQCIVHWNSTEKTWDCPCHGGRYEATGRVISGPPVQDLEPLNFTHIKQPAQQSRKADV